MPNMVPAPWWELAVTLADAVAEDAAALLITEGASGAEVLSADMPAPGLPRLGDPADVSIPQAHPGASIVVASFAGTQSEAEVLAAARRGLTALGISGELPLALRRRQDTDWAEAWKRFFTPISFGRRLWVVPSWDEGFAPPVGAVVIKLDPGLAFGTGQHATTALCLELLEEALAGGAAETRLIDVGCGSGVLAIAAALLGCRHIVATDNDPIAVTVTRENAALNGVGDRVAASGDELPAVRGDFDLVVANIIAPVLIALAPALAARLATGGTLVLSGVLAEQQDEVVSAFAPLTAGEHGGRLRLRERRQRGEWVALVLAAG